MQYLTRPARRRRPSRWRAHGTATMSRELLGDIVVDLAAIAAARGELSRDELDLGGAVRVEAQRRRPRVLPVGGPP